MLCPFCIHIYSIHMSTYFGKNLKSDIPAGIVVALVALPLCLGIALASGAPLFSGVIAGIIGGIVVGAFSGSQLSVSGPAAGLTVIVLNSITKLGTFEAFLLSVFLAGVIQFILGFLKAGIIGHYFPSSVIKGMLSAIGFILILKQIPHALGDDRDYEGDESFYQPDGENTFTEIIMAFQNIDTGAFIICLAALAILIFWDRPYMKNQKWTIVIPGPLVAVAWGILANLWFYPSFFPQLVIGGKHLVTLPISESFSGFVNILTQPDFTQIWNSEVYLTAATIAIIASLETLLSLDAVDKLDPYKRIASTNQELKAQGLGNMITGLLGGLPLTSVIVRSTANISSGGKTKVSAVFHGILLAASVIVFPEFLNLIPLSALAAVLLMVGYKLTKPSIFTELYAKGRSQFIPFVVTVLAIIFTDLLVGISVGILVGLYFVLKTNMHEAINVVQDGNTYNIRLEKDVSFLNKANLRKALKSIPDGAHVVIDETTSIFIDDDIIETIEDYKKTAQNNKITLEIKQPENSKNLKLSNAGRT